LIFSLNQTTSAPSSISLFTTPVNITVERQTLPDTIIRLDVDQNTEYFVGSIAGTITGLKIDEANWIVNDGGNMTFDSGLVGVDEEALQNIGVYPNPTEGIFNVSASNTIDKIRMFDSRGRLILNVNPNSTNYEVNLSDVQTGIYHLDIHINGKIEKRKISKL